jgi:hypothetical protein
MNTSYIKIFCMLFFAHPIFAASGVVSAGAADKKAPTNFIDGVPVKTMSIFDCYGTKENFIRLFEEKKFSQNSLRPSMHDDPELPKETKEKVTQATFRKLHKYGEPKGLVIGRGNRQGVVQEGDETLSYDPRLKRIHSWFFLDSNYSVMDPIQPNFIREKLPLSEKSPYLPMLRKRFDVVVIDIGVNQYLNQAARKQALDFLAPGGSLFIPIVEGSFKHIKVGLDDVKKSFKSTEYDMEMVDIITPEEERNRALMRSINPLLPARFKFGMDFINLVYLSLTKPSTALSAHEEYFSFFHLFNYYEIKQSPWRYPDILESLKTDIFFIFNGMVMKNTKNPLILIRHEIFKTYLVPVTFSFPNSKTIKIYLNRPFSKTKNDFSEITLPWLENSINPAIQGVEVLKIEVPEGKTVQEAVDEKLIFRLAPR